MTLAVGTMGPLTSAALALDMLAERTPQSVRRSFYPRFEGARAALLRQEIDLALVPHCHPVATEMLFDPRFDIDMQAAFDKPNPTLYLARGSGEEPQSGEPARCAAVPIVWPLVAAAPDDPAGGGGRLELLAVPSNPAAAQAVLEGRADLAITNEPSLRAYGLQPIRVLKHVVLRWLPVRLTTPPADRSRLALATTTGGAGDDGGR